MRLSIILFSFFIMFSWAIVSAINPLIALVSLLPAIVLLLLNLSGTIFRKLSFVFLVLVSALTVNATSTKHSLFFPIAKDGYLTLVSETWSRQLWEGTGNSSESEYDVVSRWESASCVNGLPSWIIVLDPKVGDSYPLMVEKSVNRIDMIGIPVSTSIRWGMSMPVEVILGNVFEEREHYDRGCYSYNKPLVRNWVRLISWNFTSLVKISYFILSVNLIYRFRKRNTSFFNRN